MFQTLNRIQSSVRCVAAIVVVLTAVVMARPAAAQTATFEPATFKDTATEAGIDAILQGTYAHAAAWGDVNGDGYPDLYWGSFGHKEGPDRLLINNRNGTFSDSPQAAINRTGGRASGAVFVDLDNDGFLDLIINNNWRNGESDGVELLRNDGKGNFTDVTAGSGLDVPHISGRSAFILDFDGDGLLDVLLQDDWFGGKDDPGRCFLLHNNGKMKFTDVTAKAGLPREGAGGSGEARSPGGRGRGAKAAATPTPAPKPVVEHPLTGLGGAVGDLNGDGRPDFVNVSSAAHGKGSVSPNIRVFMNNGGGTFREAKNFDFNGTFPAFGNNEDWTCGATIGDLNNDGRMDLVIGVHYGSSVEKGGKTKPVSVRAYLNMGNDAAGNVKWQDITTVSGLKALNVKQPHVEIQDFNNDGLMDIWSGAAMKQTATKQLMPYIQYNTGIDANGIPHFAPDPSLDAPTTFEGYKTGTHESLVNPKYFAASPTADYDLDGKLDIFGADWSTPPADNHSILFHNTSQKIGNYLDVKVDLGAGVPNRFGIGAKVSLYRAGQSGDPKALLGSQLIEISNGYCSGITATAHFGLGSLEQADVVVQMPNGGPAIKAANVTAKKIFTATK